MLKCDQDACIPLNYLLIIIAYVHKSVTPLDSSSECGLTFLPLVRVWKEQSNCKQQNADTFLREESRLALLK